MVTSPGVFSRCNYKSITSILTQVPLPFGQVKSLLWLLSPLSWTFVQAIYLLPRESSQRSVIGQDHTYLFNSEQQKTWH